MNAASTKIKQIPLSKVLPIRHQVMWPDKPFEYIMLPNDDRGSHFGLFINGEIIAVISLFIENNKAQFRKFATLVIHQGKGFGTMLLKRIVIIAQEEGVKKIWCNARVEKSKFYERFGLKSTDKTFEKGGIHYVIMEKIFRDN